MSVDPSVPGSERTVLTVYVGDEPISVDVSPGDTAKDVRAKLRAAGVVGVQYVPVELALGEEI